MNHITIGRARNSDIALQDTTVSREHAELKISHDGRMLLSDLASSGGTYIFQDGRWARVTSTPVTPEDRVRLGGYETTIGMLLSLVGHRSPSGKRKRYERDPETGEIIVRVE